MKDNHIILDLDLLKYLLNIESQKFCGKCMKRFELSDDKNSIKVQIKELIYEEFRNIYDTFLTGKLILINSQEQKSKE